ncbi:MAG: glycosyltransferase family 4 protein [Anaerolineae bacterium]|nr:glycosyltransferase family 4 protein [Anaerolineae bacterium]
MKVAINGMFWNQPTTGSGQYVRALVAALHQRAPQNDYVVIEPSKVRGQESGVRGQQSAVSSRLSSVIRRWSAVKNLAKVWFEQITFPRACQRARADVAHVPYFGSPLVPPTRTVVTIHDLIPIVLPAYRGSLLVRAYTALVAQSARRADAIIADSECSKRDIVTRLGIDAMRVRVVYLAADARYRPLDDVTPIENVRRKYALPEKYFLYLGGYDQRKNVRVIIEAFARAALHRDGYRLVLAGVNLGRDSEFFPDPRRLARAANLPDDALCCIGWVDEDDKVALYAAAHAFLFPSRYEGFGLPPLEAMACGVPVLCANTSSLPEVVGDAAMLLPPDDVDAWADAMRTMLTNDAQRAEMRARGIIQARKFSWARCAEETAEVYCVLRSA